MLNIFNKSIIYYWQLLHREMSWKYICKRLLLSFLAQFIVWLKMIVRSGWFYKYVRHRLHAYYVVTCVRCIFALFLLTFNLYCKFCMLQLNNFSLKINVTGLLLIQFVASRNVFLYYEFLIHFYNKFVLWSEYVSSSQYFINVFWSIFFVIYVVISFIYQVMLYNMILQYSI